MPPPRGKPPAMKALTVLLSSMGNTSFCSIACILGVGDSDPNRDRDEARDLPVHRRRAGHDHARQDVASSQKKICRIWDWRGDGPRSRGTTSGARWCQSLGVPHGAPTAFGHLTPPLRIEEIGEMIAGRRKRQHIAHGRTDTIVQHAERIVDALCKTESLHRLVRIE